MEQMTPRDVLLAARKLLTPSGCWTQEEYRRDATGAKCKPEEAVSRCAEGSLIDVCRYSETEEAHWDVCKILETVIGARPGGIEDWNDQPERTHAEVLDALDAAAALAEQTL